MFEAIEVELIRICRMAEETGDELLQTLIDLAIVEATAKQHAANDNFAPMAAWLAWDRRAPTRK